VAFAVGEEGAMVQFRVFVPHVTARFSFGKGNPFEFDVMETLLQTA
jgi:hypothetical protein